MIDKIFIFDIVIAAFVLYYAAKGLFRGLTNEVLGIAGWILAAVATYFAFPEVLPYTKQYVTENDLVADMATGGVIFIVSLIIFIGISNAISHSIKHSALGGVDRFLGLFFGAAKSVAILCVIFLLSTHIMSSKNFPAVVQHAYSYKIIEQVSHKFLNMLPQGSFQKVRNILEEGREMIGGKDSSPSQPVENLSGNKENGGYSSNDRQQMDNLVGNNQ